MEELEATVLVSGHPRTGTSTMMRMVKLGGMEVIAAEYTTEQDNYKYNPDGIFEIEQIKDNLPKLTPEQTAGKALKLIAPYIGLCPLDRPLKIIFMTRDLPAIVASLMVQNTVWEQPPWETIRNARRFIEYHDLPCLFVDYNDMVKWPRSTATVVADFLEMDLDIDAMASVVDPNVRDRSKKIGPKEWEGMITLDKMLESSGIERIEEE
jgi:hypothetical protein